LQEEKAYKRGNLIMPELHIVSWNCHNGNRDALIKFIEDHRPDLVALQECSTDWFKDKRISDRPNGYCCSKTEEAETRKFKGNIIEMSRGKQYAVLFRDDRFKINGSKTVNFVDRTTGKERREVKEMWLLNYFEDRASTGYPIQIKQPENINQARDWCFDRRPPAMISLKGKGAATALSITLFNWHAPLENDGQEKAFQLLEMSVTFREKIGTAEAHDLVILAGDLNNTLEKRAKRRAGYFGIADPLSGVSFNIDHILTNSGCATYADKISEGDSTRPWDVMDSDRKTLITGSGDHTAIEALIEY
jgi:hypothetical protein